MIRIVGGTCKGRVIRTPKGEVRPATSRVRQSLFDYLSNVIPNSKALDLYAGSGGFGLESLSRGAESTLFVDLSARSIAVARDNAEDLGFTGQSQFICKDVFRFLNMVKEAPLGRFDLVYASPPYRKAEPERLLEAIEESEAVTPGGVICLEFSRHTPYPDPRSERLSLDRRKEYGETVIDVWDYE